MFIFDIIIFLVILGLVVLVHELGHFWAAKLTKTRVDEFSIGFPPKIWQKKVGETNYVLGAVPLGGYNKIYGMDTEDEKSDSDPHSYDMKGPWARALICFGGVFMNIVFASLVFYIVMFAYNFKTYQPLIMEGYNFKFGTQVNRALVSGVKENSPASRAGINPHDVILAINGKDVYSYSQTVSAISGGTAGQEMSVKYLDWKTKEERTTKITPEFDAENKRLVMGVGMSEIAIVSYDKPVEKALAGFMHSYNFMDYSFSAMGYMFNKSVSEKSAQPLADSMAGPVGIFAVTKIIVQNGLIEVVNLIAVLSLALGLTNLLPIPAMDGAKLIFIALESINKKIFSKQLQAKLEMGGFAVLILLAVVMLVKDVVQFKDIIFKL